MKTTKSLWRIPLRFYGVVITPAFLLIPAQCAAPKAMTAGETSVTTIATTKPVRGAAAFRRGAVLITGGPFARAMATDKAYLLHLDPDRLLSYVRKNAGLQPKAKPYGGWDSDGASTVGHYLSACSLMYAATGDPALKKRLDYVVAELAEAQNAGGDGGIYAFAWDKDSYFAKMKTGELLTPGVNGWYLTHKIFAGLRDAAREGDSPLAKETLIKMTDWAINVTAKLTPEQWQSMLNGEHGGPHEIFVDVYAMTGDKKYLDLAEKFKHEKVFEPLAKGDGSVLNGLHANTQVPKFIGYERIYEETGEPIWHTAAQNFFDDVTTKRTWANGGNSQWEAFFAPERSEEKVIQTCGPETCNTYNMLKLGTDLFLMNPSARYMDYQERALYNHILPAIAPDTEGGFVYYTSLRPGHYRVFSQPHDAFWCCVGTGMENPAKYSEMIYAHTGTDKLYVNLFIPSTLDWQENGVKVAQQTSFPAKGETTLVINGTKGNEWTLAVRHPECVSPNGLKVAVNGKPVAVETGTDGYATIKRAWKTGDKVTVALPMSLSVEPLTDSKNYVAFKYGPLLLGGELGTEGLTRQDFFGGGKFTTDMNVTSQRAKKALPSYAAPVIVGDIDSAIQHVAPVAGKSLTFTLSGNSTGKNVTLVPFNKIFYERYATYFRVADAATAKELARRARHDEIDRRTLTERTVDRVLIADDKSETAHGLVAEQSSAAKSDSNDGPGWRDAKGFFRYTMAVQPGVPMGVRASYWGADAGREFDILVNGQVVGTQKLTAAEPADSIHATYPIPAGAIQGKKEVTVEFRPKPGSVAGGVFDVRTVHVLPDAS